MWRKRPIMELDLLKAVFAMLLETSLGNIGNGYKWLTHVAKVKKVVCNQLIVQSFKDFHLLHQIAVNQNVTKCLQCQRFYCRPLRILAGIPVAFSSVSEVRRKNSSQILCRLPKTLLIQSHLQQSPLSSSLVVMNSLWWWQARSSLYS